MSGKTRATWDEYFMQIAKQVATRATCDRKHVGAVIVYDHSILATGYNGSIRGMPHCDDVGHLMEDGHCVRTVHAEANAIAQAAKNGVRIDGARIYCTASPCFGCFKLLANAGIVRIAYDDFYRDTRIFEAAQALSIEIVQPKHSVREWCKRARANEPGMVYATGIGGPPPPSRNGYWVEDPERGGGYAFVPAGVVLVP